MYLIVPIDRNALANREAPILTNGETPVSIDRKTSTLANRKIPIPANWDTLVSVDWDAPAPINRDISVDGDILKDGDVPTLVDGNASALENQDTSVPADQNVLGQINGDAPVNKKVVADGDVLALAKREVLADWNTLVIATMTHRFISIFYLILCLLAVSSFLLICSTFKSSKMDTCLLSRRGAYLFRLNNPP